MRTQAKNTPPRLKKPLVLVGLMGAGKSTIGRRLSAALSTPFVDSDHEITLSAGLSIPDIFELYGEPAFRDLEKRVMLRLLEAGPQVIASGGGAFMNEEIRANVKEKAISVWLRAEKDVLLERVSRRDTRPLLRTGDKGEILEKLMTERYPVYEEADIVIDSSAGAHEAVVDDILEALYSHV